MKKIKTVTDIQQVWNIWKMRKLTLKERIIIFKTMVISKIIFQSFYYNCHRTCCE